MKLKKGGIETIIAGVILVAVVIGLIATAVTKVSNAGESAISESVGNLAGKQVTMQ